MPQKLGGKESSQKSELEGLLEKNTYTKEGLTYEEFGRALELIKKPEFSKENCCICEGRGRIEENYQVGKAIYDTGLCQEHAAYVLFTRK